MIASLALLTAAIAYAVAMRGGDDPVPSNVTLLLVSLAALYEFSRRGAAVVITGRDRAIIAGALLFPAYVAFQLIPLPLPVLQLLSPARADLARGLEAVGAGSSFAPISISPPTTWMHLLRIAGYALTFLAVRQIRARAPLGAWHAAIPLMVLGVLESAWALAGNSVAVDSMSGSYYSKNHFAGLLEMTLPFTAVYAFVLLGRGRTREGLSTGAAIVGSALLAGAVTIFVAITSSLSKGGALATFASLLTMGMLAASRRLSGRTRLGTFGALIVLTALVFIFITPSQLVERFAVVVSDDQSEGRAPIWGNTIRLIAAYPVVGVGLGNFYPGLLPHQTYGNGLAWVHAHNDYLQLLAELGIIGALIPAGLLGLSLTSALRATFTAPTRDARLLGLACTGALVAIALHSLGDFNTYILANALVLAWICGIASTLVLSDSPARLLPAATPLRVPPLALAGFALLWTVGSLLFLQRYRNDPEAERAFCRFGICDTLAALAARSPEDSSGHVTPLPADVLLEYLRRDPAEPSRWQELGVAYQAGGRLDLARACFARALTLAPNSSPTLLMAADFHFDIGEEATALDLVSRSLSDGALMDTAAFADLAYRRVAVDRVVERALPDQRSAQAYLGQLVATDRPDDAQRVWRWMTSRGYADEVMARAYFGFLVAKDRGDAAARDWGQYVAGRDGDYPETNRVFNGGFELDPTGSPFDWRIDVVPGVAAGWDSEVRYAGRRSLRLRFDGTTNAGELGVGQAVYLPPGRYRLTALVKTAEVTTDQGVRIGLSGAGVDVATEDVRGSDDWRTVTQEFDVDAGRTLRLHVHRRPSIKFDNLVSGTVWVDAVTISPSVY